ncbi:MAG: site-specific DNA-methyltransferase [Candidatus Rickettsiella isopodorum]|nr:site-specific DNA-methyltransferase [Candidatus Rickettsiella isopodorum]
MRIEEIISKINIKPYFKETAGVIYNCNCLDILKQIPDKSIDLVLTDPPYGIKRDKGFGGKGRGFGGKGKYRINVRQYSDNWDNNRPSKIYFEEILRISKNAIIFGGNFFADFLPQGKHWIVWDKLNTMPTFGDCELIYTNINRNSVKKITCEYNGLIGKEKQRWHPTQKPLYLLTNIINNYSKETDIILDPFLGSGTTVVACKELNRKYIGIEISEKYCQIAKERLRQEILL